MCNLLLCILLNRRCQLHATKGGGWSRAGVSVCSTTATERYHTSMCFPCTLMPATFIGRGACAQHCRFRALGLTAQPRGACTSLCGAISPSIMHMSEKIRTHLPKECGIDSVSDDISDTLQGRRQGRARPWRWNTTDANLYDRTSTLNVNRIYDTLEWGTATQQNRVGCSPSVQDSDSSMQQHVPEHIASPWQNSLQFHQVARDIIPRVACGLIQPTCSNCKHTPTVTITTSQRATMRYQYGAHFDSNDIEAGGDFSTCAKTNGKNER